MLCCDRSRDLIGQTTEAGRHVLEGLSPQTNVPRGRHGANNRLLLATGGGWPLQGRVQRRSAAKVQRKEWLVCSPLACKTLSAGPSIELLDSTTCYDYVILHGYRVGEGYIYTFIKMLIEPTR